MPAMAYRDIRISMHASGLTFAGLKVRDPQPTVDFSFDHSCLPPV